MVEKLLGCTKKKEIIKKKYNNQLGALLICLSLSQTNINENIIKIVLAIVLEKIIATGKIYRSINWLFSNLSLRVIFYDTLKTNLRNHYNLFEN